MFKSSILIDPVKLNLAIKLVVAEKYEGISWNFYEDLNISRTTISKICTRGIMGKKIQDKLFSDAVGIKIEAIEKKSNNVEN